MDGGGDQPCVDVGAGASDDGPLWEATWISLTPSISGRVGHSIVQTSASTMCVFGGANEEHTLQEIWEVDLDKHMPSDDSNSFTCKMLDAGGGPKFPGIYEFLAVTVPGQIWIFGGGSQDEDAVKSDVLMFDTKAKSLEIVKAENSESACCPSPRTQGGNKCLVEFDGSKYLAVLGGGVKNGTSEDSNLHLLNIETRAWSIVTLSPSEDAPAPPPRQGHVMTSIGSKIFVHGGMVDTSLFDDMHMIDMANLPHSWKCVQTPDRPKPSARAAHNVATIGHDLYIFGGLDASGEALNDLWRFETESLQWTQIHYTGLTINPRVDFAFASVTLPNRSSDTYPDTDALVIHGGVNTCGLFFDDMVMIRLKKPSYPEPEASPE